MQLFLCLISKSVFFRLKMKSVVLRSKFIMMLFLISHLLEGWKFELPFNDFIFTENLVKRGFSYSHKLNCLSQEGLLDY